MNKLYKILALLTIVIIFSVTVLIEQYKVEFVALLDDIQGVVKKEKPQEQLQVAAITPKALNYEGSLVLPDMDDLDSLMNDFNTNPSAGGAFDLESMARSITAEALKAFSGSNEHALPLVSHWNTGIPEYVEGMDPMYMFSRIEQGEHILVSWKLDAYYSDSISFD